MAKPVKPAKKKKSGNLLVHVVLLLDILYLPGILIPFRLRGPDLPLKGMKPPAHCDQKQHDHHMDQQIT